MEKKQLENLTSGDVGRFKDALVLFNKQVIGLGKVFVLQKWRKKNQ
jgi:hypothetical protein